MIRSSASPDAPFRRTVLPNGLTVLTEFVPGVRSVALGAWVRAASLHEPRDRMGVSHLLEHMVFKGTERRSAKQIALELEALGGSLDAYTSREHTVYHARVLDEHLPIACDVVGDVVFRPRLRTADLALERKVVLEEIAAVDDTPDDLVFELHNEALWGDHPYGYSILGTRETVSGLGVPELRELHARAYRPPLIVVVVSGNVDHDRLIEMLERSGWTDVPAGPPTDLSTPPPRPRPPAEAHVARAGAQTHLVLGSTTVGHNDPARYAVLVLGVLLGGGMSSRLFQRVREEMGLAYSVFTYQDFHADVGVHGVYVATAPETARAALDAIRCELAEIVRHGVPEDELDAAKGQLKGQLILSLESVVARMHRAAAVELYGEPYRTVDESLALVDGVALGHVAEVARRHFAPDAQTVLSLGPNPALE
ncbi:MAG: M16 family metallopeptidase [Gemmatimonadaceae bacterium]